MPTVAFTKFQPGVEGLVEGINLQTDSFAIKLASAVTTSTGAITEVANGNGYTTGGNTVGVNSTYQDLLEREEDDIETLLMSSW